MVNEGTNGTEDVNSTTPIPGSRLPDNSSSPSATASSTQTTATPTRGVSSSTTHVTNTSQPNTTTTTPTSVILTIQPSKTSQTVTPTTASAVTSPQGNATVVTASKTSSTSVTATSKSEAVIVKTSRFDVGSFVGGIVLTLGVLVILYIGCKTYHSRRGIQYRTMLQDSPTFSLGTRLLYFSSSVSSISVKKLVLTCTNEACAIEDLMQMEKKLGRAAQMTRGLVRSPAEGTGASLSTPSAEGSNALGVLCRMAGAVPMSGKSAGKSVTTQKQGVPASNSTLFRMIVKLRAQEWKVFSCPSGYWVLRKTGKRATEISDLF
ncbi:hypothetical protein EK904_000108 [Melospiza melodia maxima]|nr:hypothetical protein EK904_000108 [Melospiza melodia maxima]